MRRTRIIAALAALAALTLAGCGAPGSSGGGGSAAPSGSASGSSTLATCKPVAGDQLVVLEDDKNLQTVDNIIPAVNAAAAQPAMIAALDAVSATLDTPALIALNKKVDIERSTSSQAAQQYYKDAGITVSEKGSGKVVVGAGNFSESATLAELYALALRDAGYDAEVRTIGNRETYEPALESGEITVVPEYAGTLTEFLNKKVNGPDATDKNPQASADLDSTVKNLHTLGEKVGLTFGAPSKAADENAFAVTTAFAKEHDVKTLSDLAGACGGLVLGGPPECPDRPFCEPGLKQTYGLDITQFVSLDAGGPLTKQALTSGQVTFGLVFSSDAALAQG
ncbi:glycine betaine ABC transporter substrate-binding protein [Georgenia thermotolerans]|uniref:Glycine/betaine ABC transporter substrate-binding protein n=1 Tax=Georgenia thermotolerans TaxID=527326 RepID=A0A7J5UQ05_9MICO|nr:glycine betaine ABC transporter substrate-binding protein [Georgenia thermotolerans]KAE8764492.1 glycine/betaine ABC transporter substrate-binding protein [Georgenia thermotolerans]